ncbi:MAG: exonuclease SbcCD subunit D C-terminal domain-containing protein [Bacteroidales bacterium]|jgi:exonuclease SbcD|nr:exonuclease SbcCD subunit D C-terminal domain-containing protein [Bacteroidales bacterium]
MKFIHTADWHLGQNFFDNSRIGEQKAFLCWLHEHIVMHNVSLLCIAGDVFDTQNPSAEAQKIYYDFLINISRECPQLQIIIIAGNHDSAARLEAPKAILATMNVHVVGVIEHSANGSIDMSKLVIPLLGKGVCVAIPYVRQGDYNTSQSYSEGVSRLFAQACEYAHEHFPNEPIVAMGHLYASGAEISENDSSERLMIGGIDAVSVNTFPKDIAYLALGHLHKAQRIGAEHIRYAGSPLPMSFAEINYKHGVNLVEIANNSVQVERLEFAPPAPLLLIPRTALPLSEVLAELHALPDANEEISHETPYLFVQVLVNEPLPSLRTDIEQAIQGKHVRFVGLKKVEHTTKNISNAPSYNQTKQMTPLQIAEFIYHNKYNKTIPNDLHELLQQAINEVESGI